MQLFTAAPKALARAHGAQHRSVSATTSPPGANAASLSAAAQHAGAVAGGPLLAPGSAAPISGSRSLPSPTQCARPTSVTAGALASRGPHVPVPAPAAAAAAAAPARPAAQHGALGAGAGSSAVLSEAVVGRLEEDCMQSIRSWCKLGYGEPLDVAVEHWSLDSGVLGHLTTASASFTGPDQRTHALLAVTVAVPVDEQGNCLPGSPAGAEVAASGAGRSIISSTEAADVFGSRSTESGADGAGFSRSVGPNGGAPQLDPLPGLALHWGCAAGKGKRWQGAESGWHTVPGVSYDAGGGAWQTPFAVRQAIPLGSGSGAEQRAPTAANSSNGSKARVSYANWRSAAGSTDGSEGGSQGAGNHDQYAAVYSALLQLPWEGAIKKGGVTFVLKTARDQWFKGVRSAAEGEADFWLPTAQLPLLGSGSSLQPEVFHMTSSDSLPQVVNHQPQQATPAAANGSGNGNGHTSATSKQVARANGNGNGRSHKQAETPPPPPPAQPQPKAQAPAAAAAAAPAAAPAVSAEEVDLLGYASSFITPPHGSEQLLRAADRHPLPGRLMPAGWMVDQIAGREEGAQRSLMHRYSSGAELVEMAAGSAECEGALAAIAAWFRFSAARQLVWNRNYNVKPREISEAQGKLAAGLANLATRRPSPATQLLVRVALAAVGRGGPGEVGQRIRDEILAIQQRNGTKGGMMEEWHQKLHNNTSPDDVVICQALLDYIASGLDIRAYWATLSAANITAQRLKSFDRPIVSEPRFSAQQAAGLQRDLTTYLEALKAVHGGDDLRSAANNVLGYVDRDLKGKEIRVPAATKVAAPHLTRHLRATMALQQHLLRATRAGMGMQPADAAAGGRAMFVAARNTNGKVAAAAGEGAVAAGSSAAALAGLAGVVRFLAMCVEARYLLRPALNGGNEACGGRLVDVVFLDMALDSAARSTLETHMVAIREAAAEALPPGLGAAGLTTAPSSGSEAGAAGLPPASGPGSSAGAARLGQLLELLRLVTENAALSCVPNDDLVYSNKWLRLLVAQEDPRDARDRLLQALAICDRLKRALGDASSTLGGLVQPAAEALGGRLGIKQDAIGMVGEEVVRGTSSAPLAQLLALLEPRLRQATGGGDWQIVSRGSERPVAGKLRLEADLAHVQHEALPEPTVLLVGNITGAEEIPWGCVAVLVGGSGHCPDVLSHSAVRARNMGVLLAACFSDKVVEGLRHHEGQRVMVRLEGNEVKLDFSRGSDP